MRDSDAILGHGASSLSQSANPYRLLGIYSALDVIEEFESATWVSLIRLPPLKVDYRTVAI